MRMADLRHMPFQVTALPLQVQIMGSTEPDALGHTECLLQDTLVERLQFAEALPKPRHGIWREALGYEERGSGRRHDGTRHFPARHHQAKQADLVGIEGQAQRRHGIQREYPAKAFRLLEQHARGDDAARGVGGEMTEGNLQRIERSQHVERVLAHGIVGKIGRRRRPVTFAATAPVDADSSVRVPIKQQVSAATCSSRRMTAPAPSGAGRRWGPAGTIT